MPRTKVSVPDVAEVTPGLWSNAIRAGDMLFISGQVARPFEGGTGRLSTDQSPSPLLDITTTATGLLCWRDSHPLEWQLASLHGQSLPKWAVHPMSAFPPLAAIERTFQEVRLVP